MENPTDKTFERLSQIFDNPDLGGEDWDLIFADPERVAEFCDVYERDSLNADEKTALMQLIVASYDRYLDKANHQDDLEVRISRLLGQDFPLHEDTIVYWSALESHDPNSLWAVSPLMREILLKRSGEA